MDTSSSIYNEITGIKVLKTWGTPEITDLSTQDTLFDPYKRFEEEGYPLGS